MHRRRLRQSAVLWIHTESPLTGKGRKLCQIADITADRGSLERLVEICNREGLSLCHLYDVVEDFLGGTEQTDF